MARDDAVRLVHEDGVREPELADRRRDLGYLRVAMGARVAGIWDQRLDADALDLDHVILLRQS